MQIEIPTTNLSLTPGADRAFGKDGSVLVVQDQGFGDVYLMWRHLGFYEKLHVTNRQNNGALLTLAAFGQFSATLLINEQGAGVNAVGGGVLYTPIDLPSSIPVRTMTV